MLLMLSSFMYAQITITAADVPAPKAPFNMDDVTGLIPNPTPSANFTWDYGNIFGNNPFTNNYYEETTPAFVAIGIDSYQPGFKSLTSGLSPNLGYNLDYEFDFNAEGADDAAQYIPAQNYSIGALTGNTKDTLYIPTQAYQWGTPRRIMQFPFTYQDSWFSLSVRQTNFNLTVTAFGLNKIPGTHLYAIVRQDTIAGWGKMRVYTPNGPSVYYDVLVDQITQFAIDSFYLGGSPAPPTILTPFGMTQGQITDVNNRLNVYRKGSFQYLFSTYYGANDHTVTPLGEFVNTDDLVTSTENPNKDNFSVLVYPNPCRGNDVNVKVYGLTTDLTDYQIMDVLGRTVSSGKINNSAGIINLSLPQTCNDGTYFIYLNDSNGKTIINEDFLIQR